jgi:hypothetical protein
MLFLLGAIMNKWYFSLAVNFNTISVFETSEYEGRDGYDTKEQAIEAAKAFLDKEIQQKMKVVKELTNQASYISDTLSLLIKERNRL